MNTRSLQLDPAEIAEARKKGGLTFAPRARGLRCLQIKRLGIVSRFQADGLRAQVWPREKNKKKDGGGSFSQSPKVTRKGGGGVNCYRCHEFNARIGLGEQRCAFCNSPMIVEETLYDTGWRDYISYSSSASSRWY